VTFGQHAGAYIRLIRPKHWVKNLFVFAALIFARELFHPGPLFEALKAFVVFCLSASAIYIINDVADADADRAHPEKRHRPIASGAVPVNRALTLATLLLAASALIVSGMNHLFIIAIFIYLLMNLAYSFRLKQVVLLDVFIVAAGFMLRVLGGAYAINVTVSSWLVLCSLFISLFLGFAKRKSELQRAEPDAVAEHRPVLAMYSSAVLDQMLTIAAAGAVISYALYTVAPRTVEIFHTEKLIYTTVFVIFGVFRYLHLIYTSPDVENPTNAVTRDIPIIVTVLLWIASCVAIIYSYSPGGPLLAP
jgi:4-hydroxybenzoate polyprenyltransferase